MTGRLQGKRTLVTGGASGIGRASVELFVAEGARVVLADINRQAGEAVARGIGSTRALFIEVDISEEKSVDAMVGQATEWLGGLDILVNNAGVGGVGRPGPLADLTVGTWDKTIATNLKGPFLVSKLCLPHMVAGGGGSIVNLVSTYSVVGGPGFGAYCASKGGLLALTRSMAIDYAAHKIRVNALAPGFVDTPLLREDIAKEPSPDAALAGIIARIPQGELMTAEQVAKVVLFLSSDDSGIMTGALLIADGGFTAR
jgi:NAD(P)-dependent dehydrogenase (short-subunit alcohol dehydrogenase family)